MSNVMKVNLYNVRDERARELRNIASKVNETEQEAVHNPILVKGSRSLEICSASVIALKKFFKLSNGYTSSQTERLLGLRTNY